MHGRFTREQPVASRTIDSVGIKQPWTNERRVVAMLTLIAAVLLAIAAWQGTPSPQQYYAMSIVIVVGAAFTAIGRLPRYPRWGARWRWIHPFMPTLHIHERDHPANLSGRTVAAVLMGVAAIVGVVVLLWWLF